MGAAGAVTVSASVPACPPMPTSAASTGWLSTGGPRASAVSVQTHHLRGTVVPLLRAGLWGPITLVSIYGVLTMCQASAWLVCIIHRIIKYPGGSSGKEPACQCRRHKRCKCNPWVQKIPWRGEWLLTPVCLPGESHGQRSLVGCTPKGGKGSDTTETT